MKGYRFLLLFLFILLTGIVLYCLLNMTYNVAPFRYSKNIKEAEKEKTLIVKYFVFDANRKQISNAWLEYARSYDIFNNKKIEKGKVLLSLKEVKKIRNNNDIYWEAFFY